MRIKSTIRNAQQVIDGNKLCSVCRRVLPLDAFSKEPTKSSGYVSACIPCRRAQKRTEEHLRRRKACGGDHCWYCGVGLTHTNFSVDHVVPRIDGGEDHPDNLVASCRSCNKAKKQFSLEEFRDIRRRQRDGVPRFRPDQLAYLKKHGIALPEGEPFVFWGEIQEHTAHTPARSHVAREEAVVRVAFTVDDAMMASNACRNCGEHAIAEVLDVLIHDALSTRSPDQAGMAGEGE